MVVTFIVSARAFVSHVVVVLVPLFVVAISKRESFFSFISCACVRASQMSLTICAISGEYCSRLSIKGLGACMFCVS